MAAEYTDALTLGYDRVHAFPARVSEVDRAEIARVASAPHEGEEGAYPGTCRDQDPTRRLKRPAAGRASGRASSAPAESTCQKIDFPPDQP